MYMVFCKNVFLQVMIEFPRPGASYFNTEVRVGTCEPMQLNTINPMQIWSLRLILIVACNPSECSCSVSLHKSRLFVSVTASDIAYHGIDLVLHKCVLFAASFTCPSYSCGPACIISAATPTFWHLHFGCQHSNNKNMVVVCGKTTTIYI